MRKCRRNLQFKTIDKFILTSRRLKINLDKIMLEQLPITTLRLSTMVLSIRDSKSTRIRPKTIHPIRTRKTFLKGNCKDKLSQKPEIDSSNNHFLMCWLLRSLKKRPIKRDLNTINSILRTFKAQTLIHMVKRS